MYHRIKNEQTVKAYNVLDHYSKYKKKLNEDT